MKVFSATDIGQKRTMNQDFVFASASPVGNLPNLFVVADGMGGHNAGDFASRYGVSVLVESVKRDTNFNPVRIIRHGIEAANSQIFEQAKRDISMEGMGTTMVVATVVGNYAYVANVGDSRLYLAADGTFDQVTQDHSPDRRDGAPWRTHSRAGAESPGQKHYYQSSRHTGYRKD